MEIKKTLYTINAEIQEFVDKVSECVIEQGRFVDVETGQIIGSIEELDALNIEREKKIENCLYVVKNYDYEMSSVSGEIEYLQDILDKAKAKRNAIKNRKERFEQYLLFCLDNKSWKSKDKDVNVSCVVRGVDSCVVVDVNKVPREWIKPREITEKDVMKMAIKKAIKNGADVPQGVEIKKTYSLTVK